MNKTCCNCHISLDSELFYKDKIAGDGLSRRCKHCAKEKAKEWARNNPLKRKNYLNEYVKNNKEKILQIKKKYRDKDTSKYLYRLYKIKNKNRLNEQGRKRAKIRLKEDKQFWLRRRLGGRLRDFLKSKNSKKRSSIIKYLDCSLEFLRQHLESKFKDGMSWDNHGVFGWHIDHIIPCSAFDLTIEEEVKKCFSYKNLQPLWAKENIAKSDKILV